MTTEERMLKNFISKYGTEGLSDICRRFLDKESNQLIADHFGVTRQRVHQWQRSFTEQKVTLKGFVDKYLDTDK